MTQDSMIVAGIDTAKDKLDIAIHGRKAAWQVANGRAGWAALAVKLAEAGVGRVGIEASGGYERSVIAHLRTAGIPVLLMQPAQVRAYARAHLRRAKNDRLDAALIAACAAQLEAPAVAPDPRLETLAGHLTFIEQTEEDIARAKVRREKTRDPRLCKLIQDDIARLKARRRDELRLIAQQLGAHNDLAGRLKLLLSVPGIGPRTAIAIVVRLPEIGRIDREQAAALAGLAPFDDDSGKRKGPRHIAGGRSRLRRSLYAAALPAAFRWNKALGLFYRRLIAAGKPHKLALVACARKLLTYANTVVQRGTPWTEKLSPV